MKRFLIVSALILMSGTAFGEQEASSQKSAFGSPQSDTQSEIVIRKIYADFTAAWNKHDVSSMAKMWALDGDQVEPDGRHAKGRAEVEKLLTAEHETVFK